MSSNDSTPKVSLLDRLQNKIANNRSSVALEGDRGSKRGLSMMMSKKNANKIQNDIKQSGVDEDFEGISPSEKQTAQKSRSGMDY